MANRRNGSQQKQENPKIKAAKTGVGIASAASQNHGNFGGFDIPIGGTMTS